MPNTFFGKHKYLVVRKTKTPSHNTRPGLMLHKNASYWNIRRIFIVHLSSSVSVSERSRSRDVVSYYLNLSIFDITSGHVHPEEWWLIYTQTLSTVHPIWTIYSLLTLHMGVSTQCVMSKVNTFWKGECSCPLQNVTSQMDRFCKLESLYSWGKKCQSGCDRSQMEWSHMDRFWANVLCIKPRCSCFLYRWRASTACTWPTSW